MERRRKFRQVMETADGINRRRSRDALLLAVVSQEGRLRSKSESRSRYVIYLREVLSTR